MVFRWQRICSFSVAFGISACLFSAPSYGGLTKASEKFGEKIVEMKTRKYMRPDIHEVSSRLVQSPEESGSPLNVIYSIGLEQTPENLAKVEEEEKKLRELLKDKRAKKLSKKLIKYQFAKMFSVTKKSKERQTQKMLKVFEQFADIIGNDEEYANYLKYQKIDKYVLSGIKKKKTNLSWTYRPAVTLEQVYKDIASGQVQNVIFIVHGDENGYVYDSLGNRLDGTFFNLVSPALRSMSFFSCHGDQLISTYSLDKLPPDSYLQPRLIFTVPQSEKLGGEALSLTSGIKYFIRQVDKTLHKSLLVERDRDLNPEFIPKPEKRKMCSLRLGQFKTEGRIYALRLNRQFIGATSEENSDFNFDCSYLSRDSDNTLVIVHPNKDQNYNDKVPAGNEEFWISVTEDGITDRLESASYQHFSHKNQDGQEFYRSSKIVFGYHQSHDEI